MRVNIMVVLYKFWNRYSKIVTAIAIVIIAFFAFWLRMQQYFNVIGSGIASVYPEAKLDELDTFFNYWVVSYLDKHGLLSWPSLTNSNPVTCIFWYPSCRNLFASDLQGHIITIYVLYETFKSFGISLYDLMAVLTPIMGALASIFIALSVNEATGSKIGSIVAALIYAMFFVSREVAGFTVKYSFGLFTAPLAIWLHLRALKTSKLLDFALAGVALAYAASVWTGVGLTAIPVYASMILLPFVKDLSSKITFKQYAIGFAVESTIPFIAMYLMPSYHGGRFILALAYYIALAIFVFAWVLHIIFKRRKAVKIYAIIFAVAIISAITLIVLFDVVPGLFDQFTKILPIAGKIALGLGIRPPGVAMTVAEYQPLYEMGSLPQYMILTLLLVLFILLPISIYNIAKSKTIYILVMLIWGVLSWYATYNLSYFVDYMKVVAATCVGLSVGAMLQYLKPEIRVVGRLTKIRITFTQVVGIILAIIVVLASIPVAYADSKLYYSSYTMISRAEGFILPTTVWLDTLKFIRVNTSPNALILSWWDYGYWISVIGNRSTVADGATINSTRIHVLAEFFAMPYDKALQYLNQFGVCRKSDVYVLIFSPLDIYVNYTSKRVYIGLNSPPQFGFGDMAKFISAIIYLATYKSPMSMPLSIIASYPASASSVGGYNELASNEWIVAKRINVNGNEYTIEYGLNWNSTTVLNATMPRLYAWAALQVFSKLYPSYSIEIVPWVLGNELVGTSFVPVIDPAIESRYFDSYGLYATIEKVNQSLYSIAYTGISQPIKLFVASNGGAEAYRVVFIALLKLSDNIHSNICMQH
ncbi:MAG: STT3 domain-containing protein [Ignisphaera sp.]